MASLDPTERFTSPTATVAHHPQHALSLESVLRIHEICEKFESDWRGSGPRPRIEEALAAVAGDARAVLLEELVGLEVELLRHAGAAVDVATYLERFPEDRHAVDNAFAVMPVQRDDLATTLDLNQPSPFRGAPPAFEDYELIEEIARGGMGVVFKARQKSLNRVVALKMILSGVYASEEEARRFRQEAELAAGLDHPNIVPIHEVGEHDGRVFYTMKLIDGKSLADEVARLVHDPRGAARLLVTIARALHFAHRRGFVHCDLKPANIFLDADGAPHVTDFGLARRVDEASGLTAPGAMLGTPSYMAPEQASGRRDDLTPAADVYGLGAIFYELLTGRPPFRAATVMETVVQVLEREPAPPRELRRGVPPELEAVCLKCLEKAPADRYPSAAELAETLDQYLRGESIAATTPAQRLRRWARREPELVAHVGTLALVAALTEYNYQSTPRATRDFGLHVQVQGSLLLWAAACALFQSLLRSKVWTERARFAWAATDACALTFLLLTLDAFDSDLVVAYLLLIAASGLWFRVRLVWFTTFLAIAGYGSLAYYGPQAAQAGTTRHYVNIVVAALLATGYVVARQVRRIWALSTYYENRPVP